jgi:hypothetical protein
LGTPSTQVRAVSFNYARTERTFFDEQLASDFALLEAAAPPRAEVSIVSRSTWLLDLTRLD